MKQRVDCEILLQELVTQVNLCGAMTPSLETL